MSRQQERDWRIANRARYMWLSARYRAQRSAVRFTLSVADIKGMWPANGCCPVLGIKLAEENTKLSDNSPTLDRIDNAQGYTPENCAIISWRANRFKGAMTPAEIIALADWLTYMLKR